MTVELRDYQRDAVKAAMEFIAAGGGRRLYVSPCGTGKSLIEVALLSAMPGSYLISPRKEILDGLVDKGADPLRVSTTLLYRNRLLRGEIRSPSALIVDEAHHETCQTAEHIRICCGNTPTVAYTATPFRGTPQGTAALRAVYGAPHSILTLRDAVYRDLCSIPYCRTVPLLDDDTVQIRNGGFIVNSIEGKTPWLACADLVSEVWKHPVPTIVCCPGRSSCSLLREFLVNRVPCAVLTAETPREERGRALEDCAKAKRVLIQVQVIGEGVDLPIRCLLDFAPTTSPVRWLQQLGRAMRPGPGSEYVCTNRNLLRHGYLLEGLLPPECFVQAQSCFPQPARRAGVRVFGLEGVGRLKPSKVPLASGVHGLAYHVSRLERHVATQYVAIVLPHSPEVIWAERANCSESEGVQYGRWRLCLPPTQLSGFSSVPAYHLTEKQRVWWKNGAARYGLDPAADVDARVFAVLPVLSQTGRRLSG